MQTIIHLKAYWIAVLIKRRKKSQPKLWCQSKQSLGLCMKLMLFHTTYSFNTTLKLTLSVFLCHPDHNKKVTPYSELGM